MHGLLEELLTWLKETPYAHERLGHCGSHHLNNTTLANAQRSWRTTNFGFIRVASFAMFTGSRLGKWQVNVELYAFMCEVRRPTVGGKQWEAMLLGGCAAEPYPWHPRRKHWKANPTHLTAYKNKQRREKSRLWRRRHRHTCGESAAIEPELGVWKSSIAPSCPVSELERRPKMRNVQLRCTLRSEVYFKCMYVTWMKHVMQRRVCGGQKLRRVYIWPTLRRPHKQQLRGQGSQ